MEEMTWQYLSGAEKSEGDRFAHWYGKNELFLLADFRVATRHGEYPETDFDNFLSDEWQCHCHDLQQNAINFANGAY